MAKRIHTHLLIDDPHTAIEEAKEFLGQYPDSKALRLALIKALCLAGSEVEALGEWEKLTNTHEDLLQDRVALETLAWGVLNKGGASDQLVVRVNALLGASMTRDAKAIPLILSALRDSNSLLRSIAVGLAAQYADLPIQQEIARLLKQEEVWYVRLELIKAVGALRMKETKGRLIEIIGNSSVLAEEKVAAIVSLVNMTESMDDKELMTLVKSKRAGIRELASQIILHLDKKDKISLLLPLLSDANSAVRVSALCTLALLGIETLEGKPLMEHPNVNRLLSDHSPEVAITASWLALLRKDPRGEKALEYWVEKKGPLYARLAAGGIAISGKNGISLAKRLLKRVRDPYVKATLSLGLIGQREALKVSCKALDAQLGLREKIMWDTSLNPLFRRLSPSKVSHQAQIPNYPQVVNQMTRIELLQVLCIMNYPKAQEAVKSYLRTHTWGTAGAAAATLLQEGDDEALDVVRSLLTDKEEKVRIQAALILAMLGGDKEAVNVLRAAYPTASKEIKIFILEALAKVGDPESIAFLLERLNEPFQILRVVAATAIIRSLYH